MAKKIHLISLASGVLPELNQLMQVYHRRMKLFACECTSLEIPSTQFAQQHLILQKKVDAIAKGQNKMIVLLKEHGKSYDSPQFASWVNAQISQSLTLFFIIGAHQGFSEETLKTYKDSLSLSSMTFPHQLVPLIFLEQLYRAETLVENKPYHY